MKTDHKAKANALMSKCGYSTGGEVPSKARTHPIEHRARGGKTKGDTTVNIVLGGGQKQPVPVPVPVGANAGMMPPRPPMAPPPMGAPPPGAGGPPPGLAPRPPGMKRGGRK